MRKPPSTPEPTPGVALPDGETASSFLLRLLRETQRAFPSALRGLALPERPEGLKRAFPEVLLHAEQHRLAAPERAAIAAHLRSAVLGACLLRGEDGRTRPLDALGLDAAPLPIESVSTERGRGHTPAASYRGHRFVGHGLRALVDDLEARHRLNAQAALSLRRALDMLDPGGTLDLGGERFAILGAGAEIAPTRALLAAGASVLWLDVVPPPRELLEAPGALHHGGGRGDLLLSPDRVAATVAEFAGPGPVHLGLFAYGPGHGREWRLGAAMNAVVHALPDGALRSVGLYVSPTSPAAVSPEDASEAARRREASPLWQRALVGTRALRPNRALPGLPPVADTLVALQGVSYQAAQWLEKTVAVDAWASARPSLRVSANVAPVTETRSLEHPLFAAAFRGAPIFGVESFEPEVTRALCALAYVDDVLGAAPPGPAPRQLHGGIFALPYALDDAIKIAAVRGLVGKAG